MPRLRRPGPSPWWTPLDGVPARAWPGSGPLVVLVHGSGQTSRSLVPLGRRLAALGLRVLAPDLPAPSVQEQAAGLVRLLEESGPAVLVGCSGGSRAAVEAAVGTPELVSALVLSGPTAYASAARHAGRVVAGSLLEVPSLKPQLLRDDLRPGLARRVRRLRRDAGHPLRDRLPLVRVPTVVVRGVHDQPAGASWARQAVRALPDGVLLEVEGAAHDLHWSAPQVLARLVEQVARRRPVADVPQAGPDDALAPPHLFGPRGHAALELLAAALALAAPVAGRRSRLVLRAAGALAVGNALLADAPTGLVRAVPLPLHRNLDSGGGLLLVLAAALLLRGEPRASRLAVLALGLGTVVTADVTASPAGPARVVLPRV